MTTTDKEMLFTFVSLNICNKNGKIKGLYKKCKKQKIIQKEIKQAKSLIFVKKHKSSLRRHLS